MKLDINGIQAFVAIAELGNFTMAADYLKLSHTALSRRLKKLEEGLGRKLISRTTRSMSLTLEGTDFLPDARRLVHDLAKSLERLRAGGDSATIKIGCLPTLAAAFMPELLARYAERYPRNQVVVLDRSTAELRDALIRGEIDMAITVTGSPHPALEIRRVYLENMAAICHADHRLGERQEIAWRDLMDEPMINIGSLSATRTLIDTLMLKLDLQLNWRYEVQHVSTAIALAARGTGITVLPANTVLDLVGGPTLRAIPLGSPVLTREVGMVRRRIALSPASKVMYDLALELVQNSARAWTDNSGISTD